MRGVLGRVFEQDSREVHGVSGIGRDGRGVRRGGSELDEKVQNQLLEVPGVLVVANCGGMSGGGSGVSPICQDCLRCVPPLASPYQAPCSAR